MGEGGKPPLNFTTLHKVVREGGLYAINLCPQVSLPSFFSLRAVVFGRRQRMHLEVPGIGHTHCTTAQLGQTHA